MKISFTKMQGAGNDFVVLDGIRHAIDLGPDQIRALADRHFGVGADQVLLVERPTLDGVDFRYRIFNHDGGEVEHCGNGARCFVKFVIDQGLTTKRTIRVQVQKGEITLALRDNGEVTVDMGAPVFAPRDIPLDEAQVVPVSATDPAADPAAAPLLWDLTLPSGHVTFAAVSMGNPHAVQWVDDVEAFPVEVVGPLIEGHPAFPLRVNAGFMQVVDRHTVRLRVYERGAGETLACGTGACAAVVAGIRRGNLDSPVAVHTHGGVLTIAWDGATRAGASVMMTGPAVTVFEGTIDLPPVPSPPLRD